VTLAWRLYSPFVRFTKNPLCPAPKPKINFLAKAGGSGRAGKPPDLCAKFFFDASETLAQRGFSKTDFAKSCFQRT
jgi:hypothetical protein